jgi:hypothetical protein
MQHKNIHIIKHAKQIKTNTAYLPKSVPNAGDQLAPLYLAVLRCIFGLSVFFRLLSVYRYMYGRTSCYIY